MNLVRIDLFRLSFSISVIIGYHSKRMHRFTIGGSEEKSMGVPSCFSAERRTGIQLRRASRFIRQRIVNCIKPCAIHCKLDKVRHIVPYPSREPLEDVINGQLEQVDGDWYRFSLPVSVPLEFTGEIVTALSLITECIYIEFV